MSPLDCKEIQPVHSEGDQPWDFFAWNDAKAEHFRGLYRDKEEVFKIQNCFNNYILEGQKI